MFRAAKGIFVLCVFLLLYTAPQSGATSSAANLDSLVSLTVTAPEVALKYLPDAKSKIVASNLSELNTLPVHVLQASARLIAEKWPVINSKDQSRWYRVLFAVDRISGRCITASPADFSLFSDFHPVYVPVDAVKVQNLNAKDMKTVSSTAYGQGFSAFDLSSEGQSAYLANRLPTISVEDISLSRFRPVADAPECVLSFSSTYTLTKCIRKQGTTWYQITDLEHGGSCWATSNHVRIEKEPLKNIFAFVRNLHLYVGANLAEISARWGVTSVERDFDSQETSEADFIALRNRVSAPGMRYITGSDDTKLVLTRENSVFFGMVVGKSDKKAVEAVFGKPVEIRRDASGENLENFLPGDSTDEIWWFHDEGEFFEQIAIRFDARGVISAVIVEQWRAS